ncbi:DUF1648 domain-containing protein [Staphylococcus delphini]|uniref:DUF1648 domain-containing protein n=1 Tax=Staphylococcus delphini TaxID=53344 RepID=UPI0023B2FD86|nr:DUF1648 domain-containing protein [Staphylococcus delphini]MDE9752876.1 DUF1648 domain-containing protein [Staphylococcus delphini]MDE9790243.1 DUF1648 domain-containing protein [Staphylococcus delphini]MDE9791838.1 DUF1648 domain-containing protein [Staphylococcus delphini]MDE9794398.1 DUF1648 domain-containing protein [Staphylococcus delphini]MDE9797468.1 DUF1648 domain-containing protein [Staphylococcus delphini]
MKQINRLMPVLWGVSIVILALFYAQLPERVGTHLNLNGEVDAWGSKSHLWILPIIFLVIWAFLSLLLHYAPIWEHTIQGKVVEKSQSERRDVLFILVIVQLTVWVLYMVYLIGTINGKEGIPFWLMWLAYLVIGLTLITRIVHVFKRNQA